MSETTEKIKQLRQKTGISMIKCRDAIETSEGDMERAIEILRKQGEIIGQTMNKPTEAGRIFSYVHHDGRIGAMIELKCQTDFVARNESFHIFGNALAMQVAASEKMSVHALLNSPFFKEPKNSVWYELNQFKAVTGENIAIGKIIKMELGE